MSAGNERSQHLQIPHSHTKICRLVACISDKNSPLSGKIIQQEMCKRHGNGIKSHIYSLPKFRYTTYPTNAPNMNAEELKSSECFAMGPIQLLQSTIYKDIINDHEVQRQCKKSPTKSSNRICRPFRDESSLRRSAAKFALITIALMQSTKKIACCWINHVNR
ncbi:hypothetical protein J2750_000879 [Methanococcoides alaskense]|uniref:Uncharacterized protein n=1 Tax=Methanococcoides alaskense TaxID=325778 RepID=A0AA90TYM9_9EURY|nr:hypothetical protein [Methanococcoides alaskense]